MFKAFRINTIMFFLVIAAGCFQAGYTSKVSPSLQETKILYVRTNQQTDHWHLFSFLFITNLKVGLLIAILGLITAGVAAIAIFAWNAYSFGLLIKGIYVHFINPQSVIVNHILPHAATEILAFCLFGCIGLKGLSFVNDILQKSEVSWSQIPKIHTFFPPVFLLLISALLETFLSS